MSNFIYIVLDAASPPFSLESVLRAAQEHGVEILEAPPIVPGESPQFVFHPGTPHAVALEEVQRGRSLVFDGLLDDVADVAVQLIQLLGPSRTGTICDRVYSWSLAFGPLLNRADIIQAAQQAQP